MNKSFLLATITLLVLVSCTQDISSISSSGTSISSSGTSTNPSSTITSSTNPEFLLNQQVPYGADERQILEIAYRPFDPLPTPIVLFLHGGSWISGDKSIMRRYQVQITQAGFGYVSMNYRFITSGASYLDMLNDVRSAIQFLKQSASDFNIDPTKMAIVGESAGAHLAMLYAYRNTSPIPIQFAMGLVPPVDFTDPGYLTFGDSNFQLFLANALMGTSLSGPSDIVENGYPESWIDASPITHLEKAIPTLIGYAGQDELIPLSNMERFIVESNELNAPIETIFFENSGHGLENDPIQMNTLLSTFFQYLNRFLVI